MVTHVFLNGHFFVYHRVP